MFDRQSWDGIAKAWHAFFEENVDPHLSPSVRPEVADSWTRCRAFGIDPYAQKLSKAVDDEKFSQVLGIYEPLIEVAKPLLGIIDQCGLSNDYIFELVARNGTSLLRTGNLNLHKFIGPRDVFSEMTMGTNSHSLCMSHKTPFHITGCEHYCAALHNLAADAAPIIDENGVVVAALLLTQPLPAEPWDPGYQKMLLHSRGLIVSIASAIEYQLRLLHVSADLGASDGKNTQLAARFAKMQHMFDMSIEVSSDSIVVASAEGIIQKVSPEAAHIVSRSSLDMVGQSIEDVFGVSWHDNFGSVLQEARSASAKISIRGRLYMLRASGIRDAGAGTLEGVVLRLVEHTRVQAANALSAGDAADVTFEDILGDSHQIARVVEMGKRFAVTAENVLIIGESGTGKELFAQAIHNESRAEGPFMAINCAAIPPRLIESELFGYESGAFTGAERGGKAGKIELANGGTLFLDEIGDMPLELQATLLRVLENHRVMRLGGKSYKQVDFRVVAATNRDLTSMVQEGTFREDLLYRLAVLIVELPPLREREGDDQFFAKYFLNECQRKAPGGPHDFSESARHYIKTYNWPGNVRQMKSAVYSAYYATDKSMIDKPDLPSYILRLEEPTTGGQEEIGPAKTAFELSEEAPACTRKEELLNAIANSSEAVSMHEAEKAVIGLAMRVAKDNIKEAAVLLGISKATLYRKIKEFEQEEPDFNRID